MLVTSEMLTPKQFHTFGKKMFKQRRNDLRRMSDTFKDNSHEEKKTKKLARQSVRWRRSTINARRRKVRAKAKSQLGRLVGWKSSVCGGTNPTCGRSTSPLWSDTPWRVTPVYAFIAIYKYLILGGWTGEIASMKVMRKLTYVQEYSGGRHRNEGGNPKRTPRECRDIAKSKGLPAWGFRTGRHNDPNWRFTCFFHEHGFGRFAGNDDTMHMTGCVDISRKTANGCALSASASARLGSEDLETYPRAMARPKARLLESDWYYISVCCVLVSLASVVAFVAFRRSRTSGKRILLERVSTNYGATI